MMDTNSWKKAVMGAVREIADESYQKSAWFGVGEEISSPEEVYCTLFDDFIYDDFLDSVNVPITDKQRMLGRELRDAMNQYANSIDYLCDADKVYNDPKWNDIRILAKFFWEALSEETEEHDT